MRKNDMITESQLRLQFERVVNLLEYFNKESLHMEKREKKVKLNFRESRSKSIMILNAEATQTLWLTVWLPWAVQGRWAIERRCQLAAKIRWAMESDLLH